MNITRTLTATALAAAVAVSVAAPADAWSKRRAFNAELVGTPYTIVETGNADGWETTLIDPQTGNFADSPADNDAEGIKLRVNDTAYDSRVSVRNQITPTPVTDIGPLSFDFQSIISNSPTLRVTFANGDYISEPVSECSRTLVPTHEGDTPWSRLSLKGQGCDFDIEGSVFQHYNGWPSFVAANPTRKIVRVEVTHSAPFTGLRTVDNLHLG